MKKYLTFLILTFLSTTSLLKAGPKKGKDFSPEVANILKKRRAQQKDHKQGSKFVQNIEKAHQDQKKATAEKMAQDEFKKYVNQMTGNIGLARFTPSEQEQMKKASEKFIKEFFYEKRGLCNIGHQTPAKIGNDLSSKDFTGSVAYLNDLLTRNSQLFSKKASSQEIGASSEGGPVYHLGEKSAHTCLSPNKRSLPLTQQVISHLTSPHHQSEESRLTAILNSLNTKKTSPQELNKAKQEISSLMTKDSGFVIIPSGPSNPSMSALVKVQVGVAQKPEYRVYSSTLKKGFREDKIYKDIEHNHAFIALESDTDLVYAIPTLGKREKPILGLTLYRPLTGRQQSELFHIADIVWGERPKPSLKSKNFLSQHKPKIAASKPSKSQRTKEVGHALQRPVPAETTQSPSKEKTQKTPTFVAKTEIQKTVKSTPTTKIKKTTRSASNTKTKKRVRSTPNARSQKTAKQTPRTRTKRTARPTPKMRVQRTLKRRAKTNRRSTRRASRIPTPKKSK